MSLVNVETILSLSERRGLSPRDLARRAELDDADLREIFANPDEAKIGTIKNLADALGVNEYVLYAPAATVGISSLPDFRKADAPMAELASVTYKIIDTAKTIRDSVSQLVPGFGTSELRNISANLDPARAASEARSVLGISFDQQIEARSTSVFYAQVRQAVENDQIIVMHESYPSEDGSGFSLSDGPSPALVVINTKSQTPGRRLFTLCHELYHVIRGDSGVSSVFSKAPVEKLCDKFAENLLLPEEDLRAYLKQNYSRVADYFPLIQRIANRLKISQQALAYRIDKLKIQSGLYGRWSAIFSGNKNPDVITSGGGGGVRDENKIKLSRYGFAFAEVMSEALRRGAITYYGLYELSGLKRDFADSYFGYAKSLAHSRLEQDVLGDEA